MSKVVQERGFESLPCSTEAKPRDQVKSISTTIKADSCPIRRIGSSQYDVSTGLNRTLIKEKDPGSFTLPCFINNVCCDNSLVDLGASVSVIPLSTYLNIGLGELAHTKLTVEFADRIMKYPKGIAENVLVSIGKFVFPLEFIILDMPEDIKVPLILRRPLLSTAHAKIDVYKKDYFKESRLMGETLVLHRSLDPLFEDYVELNNLNESFELRRNQGDDLMPTIKEGEVIEEFKTRDDKLDTETDDYLRNTNAYRDEGMGDVIFGEPFLRKVGIKTKRFEGMINIYNSNDEVNYPMVRSHPSGEDRLKLMELMELSTKLSDRVLDLEKTKTAQAKEIANLKKKVKKLERKRRSRTPGMNLFKIGTFRRRNLDYELAARLKAEEQIRKPLTKAQKRNQI
nr:hypothetical protein [Tanacetum cinerariifolium]